jgi:hypothetical protein
MDHGQFDQIVARLAARRERRVALGIAGGAALAALFGRIGGVEAGAAGCATNGKSCQRADQCCSGVCKGKRGKKKCRAHGMGTCKQGQNVCTAADPHLLRCNNIAACGCFRTTAGSPFCGNSFSTTCADCRRDGDCAALGFPAGSACVALDVGACAGDCPSGTACLVPCGVEPPASLARRGNDVVAERRR